MKSGLRVAGAIGIGYLLGRTHKTRLAIALGVAAATGQLGRAPGALMERGTKAIGDSGALGQVTEPGQRLLEASKAAAVAALTSRLDTMSHVLTDRADALRAPAVRQVGGQEPEQAEEASAKEQGKAEEAEEQGKAEEPEEQAEERAEPEEAERGAATEGEEPVRREAQAKESAETEAPGGEAEEQGEPEAKADTGRRAKAAAGAPVRRGAR